VRCLGEERDRVREVPANGLDHRKASENQKCNEKSTLAGIMCVVVRTMPMTMPMLMAMVVPRLRAMAGVSVITVVLVRMRHGFGCPT